ncbi:MAG: GNAT family N-acetyltransferase [Pseudomonadota bacterium]
MRSDTAPGAVRPARPGEAEILSALAMRSKAHWGYDEDFMARCRDELAVTAAEIERHPTAVVETDGRPAGYCQLRPTDTGGEILALFVEPDALGQGHGAALMAWALEQARGLGWSELTVDSDPHAEPFYRHCGGIRIGAVPSGSIPGRELPVLRFELST